MNRQISIVTSRSRVTDDEVEPSKNIEVARRTLLPTPTGDGDRGHNLLALSPQTKVDVLKLSLCRDECGFYFVLPQGSRIDFVANGGVRIYHHNSGTAVYFSEKGDEAGAIAPHGRVHRFNDVITGLVGDKIVKMSPRGVTFTAEGKPIVYLVDSAGCKSTTDKFKYLTGDFTSQILLRRREVGLKGRERVQEMISTVREEHSSEGDIEQKLLFVLDYVFTITPTGRITVCKSNSRFFVAIEPDGDVKIKIERITLILRQQLASFIKFSSETKNPIESTASVDQSAKIEHSRLTAKCAFQRAVLDQQNQLVLCSFK